MPGWFITFEGIDGSGKSTFARKTAKYLKSLGQPVFLTKEPTATWLGAAVRKSHRAETDPLTTAFLFLADRVEHTRLVRSHRALGETVVSDRYVDSTLAYQTVTLHERLSDPLQFLKAASDPIVLWPERTFLITVDPEEGMRRIASRKQTMGYERAEFLAKVQEVYKELAKDPRFRVIDGNGTKRRTWKQLQAELDSMLTTGSSQVGGQSATETTPGPPEVDPHNL